MSRLGVTSSNPLLVYWVFWEPRPTAARARSRRSRSSSLVDLPCHRNSRKLGWARPRFLSYGTTLKFQRGSAGLVYSWLSYLLRHPAHHRLRRRNSFDRRFASDDRPLWAVRLFAFSINLAGTGLTDLYL